MAFDDKQHELHPETGFMVDKETGHHVGMVPPPSAKSTLDPDFPKWVTPHEEHIVRKTMGDGTPDHVSTPLFPDFHVDRVTKAVTVLVKDAEDEARALASPKEPKAAEAPEHDSPEPEHHPV